MSVKIGCRQHKRKGGLFMKRDRTQVKHSLTLQYTGTILGLVAGTVLLCWFLNTTFLEKYYTYNKRNSMLEGFTVIDTQSAEDALDSTAFDVRFEKICENGNISILIISADGSVIRASVNDTQALKRQFMDVLFADISDTSAEILEKTNHYVLENRPIPGIIPNTWCCGGPFQMAT